MADGVDTGNILVEAYPALTRRSGELDAVAGAVRLVSSATVDFLRFLEGTEKCPPGIPQTGEGRNYKGADRTSFIFLSYIVQRMLLRGRPSPREDRVVSHYHA